MVERKVGETLGELDVSTNMLVGIAVVCDTVTAPLVTIGETVKVVDDQSSDVVGATLTTPPDMVVTTTFGHIDEIPVPAKKAAISICSSCVYALHARYTSVLMVTRAPIHVELQLPLVKSAFVQPGI